MDEAKSEAKDDLARRQERWAALAEANGFKCAVCGSAPKFEERDAFFDTGMCGFHAYVAGGDARERDVRDGPPADG